MFIQCLQEAMLILEETTGLGQMGHGMAKNLRQKIWKDSIFVVYDINPVGLEQFIETSAVLGPLLQLNAKER